VLSTMLELVLIQRTIAKMMRHNSILDIINEKGEAEARLYLTRSLKTMLSNHVALAVRVLDTEDPETTISDKNFDRRVRQALYWLWKGVLGNAHLADVVREIMLHAVIKRIRFTDGFKASVFNHQTLVARIITVAAELTFEELADFAEEVID
jgi:hypothetical protein